MMLKTVVLVLNVLGLIEYGVSQFIQDGQCDPNVNLVTSFNIQSFSGTWFEVGRSDGDVRGADCSRFEFEVTDDEILVRNPGVNANFEQEWFGTATLENGTAQLTLNMSYPEAPFDFWVLQTDYNNFALAYNCENISGNQRSVNIWQLGRQASMPSQLMLALMNTTLVNNLGVTIEMLRTIEHTSVACTILPTIAPGEPIIFDGQCDDDIAIVQNFNASAFTGVWHEIYSYESENSQNLCARAEYTAGDGFIIVENSQVINQTLLSIFGTATVNSTDGSAQLVVVLDVQGVSVVRELKIIDTDYVSYAVSYTCENLENNRKRIYSWILGRSRQLSAQTQLAVNNVVQSELVLNFMYYKRTDQSDEACFFYPEFVPNTPVVFRGLCDLNIPTVTSFDPVRYEGIWHDIESYHSVFQTGTCRNANYKLVDGIVDVLNTQVINQALDTTVGEARLASDDGTGKLDVTFPVAGTNFTVTTNYWIVDTDYESYSLVYSCINLDENERQVWAWKLSRTKTLTPAANTAINNAMSDIPVIDQRYFQSVDQSEEGCFFFPEPQLGVPVVFPGRCDENIAVVQNFNLNQFAVTWHEIEAYPKVQQQGQCISHEYTFNGTALSLQSSQVTDQFLSISAGILSFNSTDGSARMTMDMSVDGQDISFPFWILATDYNDYALAYSCVQLNDDFRGIYSWKLSRNRFGLSANAQTVINGVIANVEVLGQQYFEPIDQSDEGCFFLPELEAGEPVILVGQCDPDIPVVSDFDAASYLGTWNLIESYPSDFQEGSCNRANYELGAVAVDVLNTQVVNQTLNTVRGSATVESSGKLLVTFPDAPASSEYWILATDYSSFALVYSCRNISTEQRRVWSWKMSRTRSLTESAVNQINSVIAPINVLNNRFYETIDHSDEGCFYFPEPQEATPVLFPGTCDQSISVMQNFNATRYLGVWHTIEQYPSRSQGGTCSNANYDLVGGSVSVLNSQVVNQTLDTIVGTAEVVSTDGSGRLSVFFDFGNGLNATQSLWVLDTDYESYSLVYSCNEVGEYREVYSWKLSRRKQLSAEATQRINEIISEVQVLEDRYYWPVDQSDAGCFYFPEPQPNVPVQFPGSCTSDTPVVQNFNWTAFQGVWHEISLYPTEGNVGECSRHEYQPGTGNTLNLQYQNVLNQTLVIVSSTLSPAPGNTNNDGRLLITATLSNGLVLQIPFWVLDVDYEDYALAYGCVDNENIIPDSDFRTIYSWKLSRTRQLSPNAEAAINNTISTVQLLRHEYYVDVDQADEACFFLPDLVPGEVVVFPGQCDPNITVVQNFRAADYLNRWFLIETYPSAFQNGSCNDATYTLGDGVVDVYNTQVIDQTLDTVVGIAVANADGTGKLLVTFPDAPRSSDYWILATDYDSYALVYSCANINTEQRAVWSWKLSRTRSLTASAIEAINAVVNTINVLDNRYYTAIDHSEEGCFYFPPPDPNTQLRFRGRCDSSISVVQDFNAAEYLGVWHLIESYPSNFQLGTCNNALYTLGDGVVDVFNTQVINQTLDTMTGFAVVASTDGGGILNVSFPISGTNGTTQTPYWILATDYNSYSLVYTCVDIDDEYVQVFSWKLGRSKQLTAGAVAAINNVTSGIQVLDERYYLPIDQSREGCFHFPEPQDSVPVVFPGQCEDIGVVQNFNLTAFQGIWHEIEAYPKEQQQGQCVNHVYTPGGEDYLNLASSQIIDLALGISEGNLTFNSTDGSARMSITINADGVVVTIPFWIVDTDYEDYALAYSCVNQGEDYRSVYSWKLSRSKSLSSSGNAAINTAMAAVDVIDQRYFEPIDQSDEGCFFLPDLAPGEPVIFPGQCDLNIPVVENFNAAGYLGRWRLIETYPSEFQAGACNEATYTLAEDGSVIVSNTQVVDQLLETVNGTATVFANGILEVNFPDSAGPSYYYVLATDYENYSLVYSCRNINTEQRRVWAWKLSRDRELSASAVNSINQVVNTTNVLDARYFQTIQQSDESCFYFPPPNGAVIFRGQCDENVTVVTDFNPVAYQGIWYDIESYPQFFQDGSCPTAEYELEGGVVNVRNTQVRAQELDVILGTAVLAGEPTEAKLIVSFPVAGTDAFTATPYWVLATDYENYALVYSCVNINEEYRSVGSWKLSRRTGSFSTEHANAISAAMANVQVLQQQYYETQSHTEEACFYYPDNEGGPVILNGQCEAEDQINVVTDFNPALFAGTWHEAARFPNQLQAGDCVTNQYEFNQGALSVTMTIVNDEALTTLFGPVTVGAGGRGALTVNLSDGAGLTVTGTMYVLDVDYDDFALLYSCRNVNATNIQVYSWKLSRRPEGLSQAANQRIDPIVAREDNLFFRYYEDTVNDFAACFYYPVFDALPEAITLPGPCDPTIRGIPQFNTQAYLGRWLEVEKYPQPMQEGECGRATYSLGAGAVDVYNTQVINQTLLVQTGTAVPASNDGTGELIVTFDVNGVIVTSNYYVLSTDYESYALVYSCRDIDNGQRRQVSSWKLSRTGTFTATATANINAAIANTQGLLQAYYASTDQSQEACFYVPEVDPARPVHLRGRCAGISGQANFNIQGYLGWWHEINSYPTGTNNGTCLSTQYRESSGQIEFEDTQVFGLEGQVVRGTVQASSDGRLSRTWSNGATEDIWVLATDYTSYSLLFSCVEIDDEYVRVWSSMQSKTRSLTPAAQEAIATAIAGNEFLIQDLYLPVDQSDDACFHYPEQTGQRVRLPGQCDASIPVQSNFDIVSYSGIWYQIERYPYPEVSAESTCIGSRYTHNADSGVVTVLNWEVQGGQLNTIQGQATVTGSAMTVVLPVQGSETETSTANLYVLATDYAAYSLVYTCENVNAFEREVVAFKLSRTRTLPSSAASAIDAYMASRQELHQPLFLTVEQNEECEEPSSSFLVKSSLLVVMLCYGLQMLM